jgi:hypothetical protein
MRGNESLAKEALSLRAAKWSWLAALGLAALTAAGCHKDAGPGTNMVSETQAIVPTDPQVVSNLAALTGILHRTMNQSRLSGNFDEFVAVSGVEVPPPPAGEKYVISKDWHVVLVGGDTASTTK